MRLMATAKFMLDQHDSRGALHALAGIAATAALRHHPGALSLELKAQQQAGNWMRC